MMMKSPKTQNSKNNKKAKARIKIKNRYNQTTVQCNLSLLLRAAESK